MERPILFSTAMVQAILACRKIMTRRIVKPQPDPDSDGIGYMPTPPCLHWEEQYKEVWKPWLWETSEGESIAKFCPYGEPGDLLWVRETFQQCGKYFHYKATDFEHSEKWKPSIHMPKAAARIWLEVMDVRVERLHEITERDVISEGVGQEVRQMWLFGMDKKERDEVYRRSFQGLWQSINGEESWQQKPWVWVVSFKVLSTTGKPIIHV